MCVAPWLLGHEELPRRRHFVSTSCWRVVCRHVLWLNYIVIRFYLCYRHRTAFVWFLIFLHSWIRTCCETGTFIFPIFYFAVERRSDGVVYRITLLLIFFLKFNIMRLYIEIKDGVDFAHLVCDHKPDWHRRRQNWNICRNQQIYLSLIESMWSNLPPHTEEFQAQLADLFMPRRKHSAPNVPSTRTKSYIYFTYYLKVPSTTIRS